MDRIAVIVSGYRKDMLGEIVNIVEKIEKQGNIVFLVEEELRAPNFPWNIDSCLLRLAFDNLGWSPEGNIPEVLFEPVKYSGDFSVDKSRWKQKSIKFKESTPKFNRKMLKR